MLHRSVRMHLIVLVCSMALSALGQAEDDWIDPYDMLNYDATTKTMRKPNVPTTRRQYSEDSVPAELTACRQQVAVLQREAISVKITTFITFLQDLLKDLPITLQILVLAIVIFVVCMYRVMQALLQRGITAPHQAEEDLDAEQPESFSASDSDSARANQGRPDRPHVRQRRANGVREERVRVNVETLRTVNPLYGEDAPDAHQAEEDPDAEQPESLSASDSDSQTEGHSDDQQERLRGASASSAGRDLQVKCPEAKAKPPPAKAKLTEPSSDLSQARAEPLTTNANNSQARNRDSNTAAERPAGLSQTATDSDAQVAEASGEERITTASMEWIISIGSPVQETSPTSLAR